MNAKKATTNGIHGVYLLEPSVVKGTASPGVISKIYSQIDAFKKAGFEMTEYAFENDLSLRGRLLRRLPFTNELPKWNYTYDYNDISFIYLRKPISLNFAFRRYMRWIKRNNPQVKVIMEIPTYPYDGELGSDLKDLPLLVYDRIGRKKLVNKVDRIALLNREFDELYGIPVLKIKNGINFDDIKIHHHQSMENRLDLCCVANFTYWHGYDRLINGLLEYYKHGGKTKVYLHMVGDGCELENLKKIADSELVSEYVIFYGQKNRSELSDIYDICDIGVGSLGMSRQKVTYNCSLKSREYMAAGLPIIDEFPSDIGEYSELRQYICEASSSEGPIDIHSVIDFYNGLMEQYDGDVYKMSIEIRETLKKYFCMEKTMFEVIDYIKGECEEND